MYGLNRSPIRLSFQQNPGNPSLCTIRCPGSGVYNGEQEV